MFVYMPCKSLVSIYTFLEHPMVTPLYDSLHPLCGVFPPPLPQKNNKWENGTISDILLVLTVCISGLLRITIGFVYICLGTFNFQGRGRHMSLPLFFGCFALGLQADVLQIWRLLGGCQMSWCPPSFRDAVFAVGSACTISSLCWYAPCRRRFGTYHLVAVFVRTI